MYIGVLDFSSEKLNIRLAYKYVRYLVTTKAQTMFLDYRQYQHYKLVEELLPILQADLEAYLATGRDTHIKAKEAERIKLGMDETAAQGWYMLPIVRAKKLTEWAYEVPKSAELAMKIPGITNLTINCFEPGHGAALHSDYDYDMRDDITESARCYAVLFGVKVPSNDIKLNGFLLGDEEKVIQQDSIFAFDGSVLHKSWNNTDQHRYTANLDLDRDFWAVIDATSLDSNSSK